MHQARVVPTMILLDLSFFSFSLHILFWTAAVTKAGKKTLYMHYWCKVQTRIEHEHFWESATTQHTTEPFQSCDRKQKGTQTCLCSLTLTSSLVVWLREIRYVWNPVSPTTDQSVKKHTSTSTTVEKTVKEISYRNTNILYFLGWTAWSKVFTNDSQTLLYSVYCLLYSYPCSANNYKPSLSVNFPFYPTLGNLFGQKNNHWTEALIIYRLNIGDSCWKHKGFYVAQKVLIFRGVT